MYANLKVRYHSAEQGQVVEDYAWQIAKLDSDRLRIYLDDPQSESNYAEPAGEVVIAATDLQAVEACF